MCRKKILTTPFIISGMILCIILFALACEKDEPTASVSFKLPGVYNGTYYVLRNYQTYDEDTSLAYVTFDFKGDYNFTMIKDSTASGSNFNVCNVTGTYIYRGDSLSLTLIDSCLHVETCDHSMGPSGAFTYNIVQQYLVFRCHQGSTYRKIDLVGH